MGGDQRSTLWNRSSSSTFPWVPRLVWQHLHHRATLPAPQKRLSEPRATLSKPLHRMPGEVGLRLHIILTWSYQVRLC